MDRRRERQPDRGEPWAREVAEETIRDVDASGHWPGNVVTEISEAGPFWEAEVEDQDYFQRYPDGCRPPFPASATWATSSAPREA
jgi:peptide methionine sulfoxide reductase MsrA